MSLSDIQYRIDSAQRRFNEARQKGLENIGVVRAHHLRAQQLVEQDGPASIQSLWESEQGKSKIDDAIKDFDSPLVGSTAPRLLSRSWKDPYWTIVDENMTFNPHLDGLAPGVVRIGNLLIDEVKDADSIPAMIPLRSISSDSQNIGAGHIAIASTNQDNRLASVAALQSIAVRAITSFPARKLRGIFIDPVGMGNSFPFKSFPQLISGPKTYTRSDEISEQLRSLTVHVEQVIQKYLGSDFNTIEEFNAEKSFIKEPYRYLFIADFPAGFDNNALEDLKSLLTNGPKAGVYVVLHIDQSLEKPRNFDFGIFETFCSTITSTDERIVIQEKHSEIDIQKEINDLELRLMNGEISEELYHQFVSELQNNQLNNSSLDEPQREANVFWSYLPNGHSFRVVLDPSPSNEQIKVIASKVTEAMRGVKDETVPYSELAPSEENEWSYNSAAEIRTPIGVSGALDKIEFWLGQSEDDTIASQALLAGKPGAGKSYTLHAIMVNLCTRYSPDELEIYLLDYKEGVEFQIYVDPLRSEKENIYGELDETYALPHAKVISIDSDREFGLSVLKRIQEELEHRGEQFRNAGVQGLKEYREKRPDDRLPRVLVVIDEFQYMFLHNDAVTRELNTIFEDITRRGRAFGIHLLLATQSPNVANMGRGVYSFIDLRMAQQMDKSTAASVLAEGNVDAIDLIEKPGEIIYNANGGTREHNVFGSVVDMSLDTRKNALMKIQEIAKVKKYRRSEPLILFNGRQATKLSKNPQLDKLSKMNHWLASRDLNKQIIGDADWMAEEFPGVSWLGEAMKIGNHTQAIFRRRSRSNMLIVGNSEETIFGILSGMFVSLVHSYATYQAEFQIIDLSYPDEENYWASLTTQFRDELGSMYPINIGKRVPNPDLNISRYTTILENVVTELEKRKEMRETNPDEMNFGPPIFFVCAIGGLNRAQTMRPVMGSRKEEPSEDGQHLMDVVAQGSELGIHTILWFDNMKSFLKLSGDDRTWLTHFDLRIALTMPAEDSRMLLKETYAEELPRLRALFRDEATTAGLEKFKPYAIPNQLEIESYGQRLKSRLKN